MLIWSNYPSVFKWWWAVSNKQSFSCGQINLWLGLWWFFFFSEDALGWKLSAHVWLVFPSEKLGPKWQMEDLQSVSLPWKVISKGARPQQDWGSQVLLLHVTASLAGKQRKRPETPKTWIFLIFLLGWKTFGFGKESDRCGLHYAEKNCITPKSLMISEFNVSLEHYYILLS